MPRITATLALVCGLLLVTAAPASAQGGGDIALPARGAFYYPWFPETWTVGGRHVFYQPTLGYYDSSTPSIVDSHVAALDRAKVKVSINSWWGPGTHAEQTRIPLLLDRTVAAGSGLRHTVYYEDEGSSNPTVATIQSDLAYLAAYADRPQWARVQGKPVIFVYNAGDTPCAVADRWRQAAAGWYVVLKVFSGYLNCANQPDAWHQYGPAAADPAIHSTSYAISPGYCRADDERDCDGVLASGATHPVKLRSPERFRQNVAAMVASGKPWQLVATFNEWGEGTAIERAAEWGDFYIDTLANDGAGVAPAQGDCNDGRDSAQDPDTAVDLADPDCGWLADGSEGGPPPPPPAACGDGLDNNGDGLVDLLDAYCATASGTSEGPPPAPKPQCSDGQDNDGDGGIDYPSDGQCKRHADRREAPDPLGTLAIWETKHYIRAALRRKFAGAYRFGSFKRIAGCVRVSRTRRTCRVSSGIGDVGYRGRATIWLGNAPNGDVWWYYAFNINRTNYYCLARKRAGDRAYLGKRCTKVIRVR